MIDEDLTTRGMALATILVSKGCQGGWVKAEEVACEV
jgi:hypothetical protein